MELDLLRAFEIINDVIENRYFKLRLKSVSNDIKKGEDLASSLNAMNLFPQFFVAMIKIGEETGNLDGMFLTAADIFYEDAAGKCRESNSTIRANFNNIFRNYDWDNCISGYVANVKCYGLGR